MSDFERTCIEFNVKKRADGCFCGLLVRRHFAKRFVAETDRKTMEIRHKAVKFLKRGERILLISSQKGMDREFLAILEFDCSIEVPDDKFPTFFSDHRVTDKEFEEYKNSLKHEQSSVFGYKFLLVHIFHNPPILPSKLGEVWLYVSPNAVKDRCIQNADDMEVGTTSSTIGAISSSDAGIKRKDTTSSDGLMPPLKKQKSVLTIGSDEIADENQVSEDEGSEHSNKEAHGGTTLVCVLLQEFEWERIQTGDLEGILRPFHTKNQTLTVLHRSAQGHVLKGTMTVIDCEQIQQKTALSESWEKAYGQRRLSSIRKCKTVWVWKIGSTTCAQNEPVRFLDVAPRYRNRTFVVQEQQLLGSKVPGPKERNFFETGKFLASCVDSELSQLLWQTVSKMKENNVCLRIGTTCSGTDVCIPALKDLLTCFNEHLKAGGLSPKNLCAYIIL